MLLKVLLVLLILIEQGFIYVNYQLLHTCESSQICHSGNKQLDAMY
jgi:hypothetical protein